MVGLAACSARSRMTPERTSFKRTQSSSDTGVVVGLMGVFMTVAAFLSDRCKPILIYGEEWMQQIPVVCIPRSGRYWI
jgi:hypothetical protein